MFKSIRLENFKAYRDTGDVPLAPLTIVVGLNNSGKSTLLNAIFALKRTAQDAAPTAALVTVAPGVNLNGFYDILHNGEMCEDKTFSISLALDLPTETVVQLGADAKPEKVQVPDRLSVSFGLGEKTRDIEVAKARFSLGSAKVLEVERGNGWFSDVLQDTDAVTFAFRNFIPMLVLSDKGRSTGPSQDLMNVLAKSSFHAFLWNHWIASLVHSIGPLRKRVPWSASVGARAPSEFGEGGEDLIAALRRDERYPPHNRTLAECLNYWISRKKILGRIHLEPDKTNTVHKLLGDEIEGPENINVAGMGEGISQILPIIARSYAASPHSCLLVEQPEIHLHPALQADMADLFIDIATTLQRQVIVETHSEHLVLRVRRRIAEGTIDPNDVSILYVEKQGAESKVRRLDINKRGHFDDWPEGFFDEAYQEAMALAMATPK